MERERRKKSRVALAALVAVVAVMAAATALLFMPRSDKEISGEEQVDISTPRSRAIREEARAAKAKAKAAKAAAKTARAKQESPDKPELTEQEQALIDKIDVAMDDEALSSLVKLFPSVESSTSPVRVAYVEALGYFGRKALPEMTPFLADSDESVRDTAANEWTMALDEIENDSKRLAIAEKAFSVVTDDDVLESISGVYLGIDDERLAVASLIRIIEGECPDVAREKAKETYNYVTGNEYNNNERQQDEDQ